MPQRTRQHDIIVVIPTVATEVGARITRFAIKEFSEANGTESSYIFMLTTKNTSHLINEDKAVLACSV
jgi:hypothetical protein